MPAKVGHQASSVPPSFGGPGGRAATVERLGLDRIGAEDDGVVGHVIEETLGDTHLRSAGGESALRGDHRRGVSRLLRGKSGASGQGARHGGRHYRPYYGVSFPRSGTQQNSASERRVAAKLATHPAMPVAR